MGNTSWRTVSQRAEEGEGGTISAFVDPFVVMTGDKSSLGRHLGLGLSGRVTTSLNGLCSGPSGEATISVFVHGVGRSLSSSFNCESVENLE